MSIDERLTYSEWLKKARDCGFVTIPVDTYEELKSAKSAGQPVGLTVDEIAIIIAEHMHLDEDDRGIRNAANRIKELSQSPLARESGAQWQPIETAPKDEAEILVGNDGSISGCKPWCTLARWHSDEQGFWETNNHPTDCWGDRLEVTHWMPHPLPPQRNQIEAESSVVKS